MNSSENIKLSTFLYRYMSQNNIINIDNHYKKEERINMDNNFKEELKQHFKSLTLNHKNNNTN
jgi:hypothetical protein